MTGLGLAYHWAPRVTSWLSPSTPQARLILVKLVLLAVTVALAIHARLRVLPTLEAARHGDRVTWVREKNSSVGG